MLKLILTPEGKYVSYFSVTQTPSYIVALSVKKMSQAQLCLTVRCTSLVAGHLGEADDVCKEDRHVVHGVHVEGAEDCPDVPLQTSSN